MPDALAGEAMRLFDIRRRLPALLTTVPVRWSGALLLGAAGAFAFAPFHWLPLLVVAASLLLWQIASAPSVRAAGAIGFWFGLGHFCVGFHWIAESFKNNPDWPDWMGPPTVLLLAAGMAVYPALAAAATRALARRGAPALLAFALAWSAVEWLRGHLLTGFPWNPVAAVWADWPALMQPLAFLGPYAYGLLTLLAAASPALLLPPVGDRRGWRWPLAALLAFVVAGLVGGWRLEQRPTRFHEDLTIRLVQANIAQLEKWDPALRRQHFIDQLALSAMPGGTDGRLLVVWPETAVPDYRFAEQTGRHVLASRILPDDGYLVTGAPRVFRGDDGQPAIANSLFVLDTDGQVLAIYDKAHLVPGPETVPARGLVEALGLRRLLPIGRDFTPGPGRATMALPGLPSFSPLICYEIIFPRAVTAGERPDFLLNITNDAWFGTTTGPYQHLASARMRAVEEGLALVRVANTGISAVLDPMGRFVARIPLGTRGTADAALPQALHEATVYARFGEKVYAFMLIMLCVSYQFTRNSSKNGGLPGFARR